MAKRKRKHKFVTHTGTVSSLSDAFTELESLGEESRELVDNASEGLAQTQRIQTFEETAGTLENLSEPEIPSCVAELAIQWTECTSRSGRANRRDNAVACLTAAKDAAESWLEEQRAKDEEAGGVAESEDVPEEDEVDLDEVEQFISELDDLIGEAEGCEFPGMFG
jgi:hypothetical protein